MGCLYETHVFLHSAEFCETKQKQVGSQSAKDIANTWNNRSAEKQYIGSLRMIDGDGGHKKMYHHGGPLEATLVTPTASNLWPGPINCRLREALAGITAAVSVVAGLSKLSPVYCWFREALTSVTAALGMLSPVQLLI